MYADHLLEPWIRHAVADLPGLEIFDDHTHVGTHDPSGFSATMTELREGLALVDGRAAVFPMAEPEGYRDASVACAAAAADSDGTLVSFARITPHEEPDKLLHEALEAGARGVKLHLSSDEFELDDPRLEGVLAEADERRLPVLVHAGPEVAEVGDVALEVCARHPGLHLVLAHCGLTDLAWIWQDLDGTPNLRAAGRARRRAAPLRPRRPARAAARRAGAARPRTCAPRSGPPARPAARGPVRDVAVRRRADAARRGPRDDAVGRAARHEGAVRPPRRAGRRLRRAAAGAVRAAPRAPAPAEPVRARLGPHHGGRDRRTHTRGRPLT